MSQEFTFSPELLNIVDPFISTIETCQQQGPRSHAFELETANINNVFDKLDALLNEIDQYNKADHLISVELDEILNTQAKQLEDFETFVKTVANKTDETQSNNDSPVDRIAMNDGQ